MKIIAILIITASFAMAGPFTEALERGQAAGDAYKQRVEQADIKYRVETIERTQRNTEMKESFDRIHQITVEATK